MKKAALSLVFTALMASSTAAMAAERIVVKIGPPHARHEVIPARPGRDHVWIGGYWRWDGGHHSWVDGRWEAPRPGYRWVPGHWDKVHGGWAWTEGHWRHR